MIISEQQLLEIRLEMEELITKRTWMAFENEACINSGGQFSMTYSISDFNTIEYKLKALREKLILLGER